ncbi:unnamed protein product [Durusdinium trenchii]|uniref:Uncharacterized protein n=2 Tax=Durusdinium trenchii TaxID=1381693 RepID=A0ABP0PPW0_9DINO
MRCVLPLGLLALGASMDVGEKNLATAKRDLELGEGEAWKTATPAEAQDLMAKEAALYAPKIKCAFTPSSPIGFEAAGKSQEECGEMFGKAFAPISTHKNWKCDWGIAEGSEGKMVIAWCPFKYTIVSTGEVISSTTMLRYEFDDAGLIIGYYQEFDTSKFAKINALVLSTAFSNPIGATLLLAFGSAVFVASGVRAMRRQSEPLLDGYAGLA